MPNSAIDQNHQQHSVSQRQQKQQLFGSNSNAMAAILKEVKIEQGDDFINEVQQIMIPNVKIKTEFSIADEGNFLEHPFGSTSSSTAIDQQQSAEQQQQHFGRTIGQVIKENAGLNYEDDFEKCSNCGCRTSETPRWRWNRQGHRLCNACFAYQDRNKGTPRPQKLWKKRKQQMMIPNGDIPSAEFPTAADEADFSEQPLDASSSSSARDEEQSAEQGQQYFGQTSGQPQPSKICRVCGIRDITGRHFGALSCTGCSSHFQRYQSIKELRCPKNGECSIYGFRGRRCLKCRLDKCIEIGMKPAANGRPRKWKY